MTKTLSFSGTWSEKLGKAIDKQSKALPDLEYSIECHESTGHFRALMQAVNQGIDSHLQAVEVREYQGEHGKRGFKIGWDSVSVLVRRLMEQGQDFETGLESAILASAICETLNIELI